MIAPQKPESPLWRLWYIVLATGFCLLLAYGILFQFLPAVFADPLGCLFALLIGPVVLFVSVRLHTRSGGVLG